MSEEPKKTEEAPAAPSKVQQVLPKVFQRFDGGELPGFLKSWSNDGPKKVNIEEIAEESELSKNQIKSDWKVFQNSCSLLIYSLCSPQRRF